MMLGAISAAHHGWLIFLANGASGGSDFLDVGHYVGLVQFLKKKISRRTNGVKLSIFLSLTPSPVPSVYLLFVVM